MYQINVNGVCADPIIDKVTNISLDIQPPAQWGPGLSLSQSYAMVGDTITVTVRIQNTGDATASGFTVGLYEDRASAPTTADAPDHSKFISSLTWDTTGQANELDVVFDSVTTVTPGQWDVYALVDSLDVVTEDQDGLALDLDQAAIVTQPHAAVGDGLAVLVNDVLFVGHC